MSSNVDRGKICIEERGRVIQGGIKECLFFYHRFTHTFRENKTIMPDKNNFHWITPWTIADRLLGKITGTSRSQIEVRLKSEARSHWKSQKKQKRNRKLAFSTKDVFNHLGFSKKKLVKVQHYTPEHQPKQTQPASYSAHHYSALKKKEVITTSYNNWVGNSSARVFIKTLFKYKNIEAKIYQKLKTCPKSRYQGLLRLLGTRLFTFL